MSSWQDAIAACHRAGEGFAVVTLLQTKGSTPRNEGTKMVVTTDDSMDTVGGGGLEHLVMRRARELLNQGVPAQSVEHFPLAGKANQCCGGSVSVLIEAFPAPTLRVAIFGAGHVGKAVVKILADCDVRIDWIDTRSEQFPNDLPANTQSHVLSEPETYVEDFPSGAMALILTHDHALDYRLLLKLLDETDTHHIGLIGSATKSARFLDRLKREGIPDSEHVRWQCPAGLPEVKGKMPMEVAVSIVGELLSLSSPDLAKKPGVSWKAVQAALGKT